MADIRQVVSTAIERVGLSLQLGLAVDVGTCLVGEEIERGRDTFHRLIVSERSRALAGARALVPALSAFTLAPADGVVAVTSIAPKDRIIAGLTPRVAFLRSLLTLLDDAKGSAPARRVETLVGRMARRVPGAVELRGPISAARVREAASRELDELAAADEAERNAALSQLVGLTLEETLYGRSA